MIAAYFIALGFVLGLALFNKEAFPFARILVLEWAALFCLEQFGMGALLSVVDALVAWLLVLAALKNPKRHFILLAQLAAVKAICVHLLFNGIAYATGGWWSPIGNTLGFAYMWCVNFGFFAIALCLHGGRGFGSDLRLFIEGAFSSLRHPSGRRFAYSIRHGEEA